MTNDEIELPEPVGPLRALDDELKKVIRTYAKGCVALAIRAYRERAQAAEPVGWSVMAPDGSLYESMFTTDSVRAGKWLSTAPENLLKLCPLYPAPARPAVTDEMVERAYHAWRIGISMWGSNKDLIRIALKAALGGG